MMTKTELYIHPYRPGWVFTALEGDIDEIMFRGGDEWDFVPTTIARAYLQEPGDYHARILVTASTEDELEDSVPRVICPYWAYRLGLTHGARMIAAYIHVEVLEVYHNE